MSASTHPAAPFTAIDERPRRDARPEMTPAQRIGTRLRRIRNQQQLSLADVQERSGGVWKAVVVGAYERGDRAITVTRLASLAEFYGVPLADLLPSAAVPADMEHTRRGRPRDGDRGRITLDLTRLDERQPALGPVARFADHVRARRGDHNGRVMSLRGGDLETVAMAVGQPVDEVVRTLTDAGALLEMDLTGAPTLTVVRER